MSRFGHHETCPYRYDQSNYRLIFWAFDREIPIFSFYFSSPIFFFFCIWFIYKIYIFCRLNSFRFFSSCEEEIYHLLIFKMMITDLLLRNSFVDYFISFFCLFKDNVLEAIEKKKHSIYGIIFFLNHYLTALSMWRGAPC